MKRCGGPHGLFFRIVAGIAAVRGIEWLSYGPPPICVAERNASLSYAFAPFHFPRVKSGISTGLPPPRMDSAESGMIELQVTAS